MAGSRSGIGVVGTVEETMSTETGGAMKYRTHKIIGAVEIIDEGGRVVGQIKGYAQQDAKAMAAGPALLEACEAMAHFLRTAPEHIYDYVGIARVHKVVFAAIAAAEVDADD